MKNRKNIGYIIFLVALMILCLTPFACMTFARTDETTEKKELAAFPSIKENDKWNINILSELGAYFDDHFAFRQYMVSADSWMESVLFQKSNVDNVIVGRKGWLFYKDSLNDYLAQDVLSDRAVYNIVYNLETIQQKVTEEGRTFVFTIAPNKNSLYGEYMPYTYSSNSDKGMNNREMLMQKLADTDVNYVDLYQLFQEQNEILYLKKDSHWNNKGALLAYNALLTAADKEHEAYESCPVTVQKNYIGDLNSMVYPLLEQPEENYIYDYQKNYQYLNKGKEEAVAESQISVEDARVQTVNASASGSLLMYRDSFGNTLLPFMANAFEKGAFYKTTPYNIDTHLMADDPDVVIIEKVERKLDDLAYEPAVMTGSVYKIPEDVRTVKTETTVKAIIPETNPSYYEVFGIIEDRMMDPDSKIYVEVETGQGEYTAYTAFAKSVKNISDYGYVAYIPQELVQGDSLNVRVYVSKNDGMFRIADLVIDKSEIQEASDSSFDDAIAVPDAQVSTNSAGSKKVTIQADGKETQLETDAATLDEMKKKGEIQFTEEDHIIPAADAELLDGEVIAIQRVVVKTETETKEIPYETEYTTSSSIYEGETSVQTAGENGIQTITYKATYIDGVLSKREKVSEEVTKEPVNEVIASGTKKHEVATEAPSSDSSEEKSSSSGEEKSSGGKKVVSKEWVEDCGSDTGYWMIVYDDGSYEFVE